MQLEPGHVAQSVTYLTANPRVASLIPVRPNTEIDCGIISTAILLLSADSRKVVVSYKPKYVNKVLVNILVKLAQLDRPDMTIAVDWDVKHQTKQTKHATSNQIFKTYTL